MIVYGDPAYPATLSDMADRLRHQVAEALSHLGASDHPDLLSGLARLDALRALLVEAGQFEQAAADAEVGPALLEGVETITLCAAEAFSASFDRFDSHEPLQHLQGVRGFLDRLPPLPREAVTVKVPEGFAFYCLYPEQYIQSARDWADAQRQDCAGRAVVVGIRSIGSTLSAVVSAALRHRGWRTTRLTCGQRGIRSSEKRASTRISCGEQIGRWW